MKLLKKNIEKENLTMKECKIIDNKYIQYKKHP